MTRRRALALGGVVAATAVAVTVAILGRPDGTARPPTPDTGVRVVVPGRPGESATVADAARVKAPDGSVYNTADAAFVQMMLPHHEQAVRLAGLAADRAADARVKALADRVVAAQTAELPALRAWLQNRGLSTEMPGHDHATMPGMQSAAAIDALTGARGADFDRRFVAMLSDHHRGALTMSSDVQAAGADQQVAEIARDIAVEQTAEINRMADLKLG
jgi:uncharacterized protein (DUF305 family)